MLARDKRGYLAWTAIIGGSLWLEDHGIRNKKYENTLSHATRYVFQTHTLPGKIAFVTSWGALTWWFLPHVIKGANVVSEAISEAIAVVEEAVQDA